MSASAPVGSQILTPAHVLTEDIRHANLGTPLCLGTQIQREHAGGLKGLMDTSTLLRAEKMPRALVRVAGGQTARVAVPSLGSGWSPLQSPGWLRCIGAISGSQVGPHTQEINLGSRSAPPGCYSGRGLSSRLLCLPCPGAHPERVARRRSGPGHCC